MTPSDATVDALKSVFWKKACGRRMVNESPDRESSSSTSPWTRSKSTGDAWLALCAESRTTWRIPARFAASIAFPCSFSTFGSGDETRNILSAPRKAGSSEAGRVRSPTTTSTPGPVRPLVRAGSRTRARTRIPRAESRRTTSPPVFPAAPVTMTMETPSCFNRYMGRGGDLASDGQRRISSPMLRSDPARREAKAGSAHERVRHPEVPVRVGYDLDPVHALVDGDLDQTVDRCVPADIHADSRRNVERASSRVPRFGVDVADVVLGPHPEVRLEQERAPFHQRDLGGQMRGQLAADLVALGPPAVPSPVDART